MSPQKIARHSPLLSHITHFTEPSILLHLCVVVGGVAPIRIEIGRVAGIPLPEDHPECAAKRNETPECTAWQLSTAVTVSISTATVTAVESCHAVPRRWRRQASHPNMKGKVERITALVSAA